MPKLKHKQSEKLKQLFAKRAGHRCSPDELFVWLVEREDGTIEQCCVHMDTLVEKLQLADRPSYTVADLLAAARLADPTDAMGYIAWLQTHLAEDEPTKSYARELGGKLEALPVQ